MSVVTQTSPRTGRFSEAALLIISVGIGVGAFCLAHLGAEEGGLPSSLPVILVGSVAIAIVGHMVIRHFASYADPVLFPSALALNGLGLAMIYRIDMASGTDQVKNQLVLTVAAIVLMVITVVALRNHRALRRYTWTSLFVGIGLLLLPMVPGLGRTINGARIWIRLVGFSFQPAEFAKICFAVFFAGYLVSERDNLSLAGPKFLGMRLPLARHFVPILTAWAICMGVLVMERDFGTAILFFGLFVGMLYVATERISWIVIGGLLATVGVALIYQVTPHIQARFVIWLHALDSNVYNDKHGSYQIVQGLFGMGSGGLFGTGLGQGYPTKVYAANSDFIVASFGEEIGLIGLLALLCIYLMIIVRGLRTAIVLRDGFGKLLLTGLAMPFLAHGGSALLANWTIIGILIRISDVARRPAAADPLPPEDVLNVIPALEKETGSQTANDSTKTQVVKL